MTCAALVTGANRGLGLEFINQLSTKQNGPVFAACRNPSKAKELTDLATKHKNIHVIQLDVEDESTYANALAEVEKVLQGEGLSLLINNAGLASFSDLETVTSDEMIKCFKVNAVGPLMVTRTFLNLLKKGAKTSTTLTTKGATVVNISTSVASNEGHFFHGGCHAYSISKAALNMVTSTLSHDLKNDNIVVVSICPGWVKTDMGGADAMLTPTQSVSAILKVVDGLDLNQNGKFLSHENKPIPW